MKAHILDALDRIGEEIKGNDLMKREHSKCLDLLEQLKQSILPTEWPAESEPTESEPPPSKPGPPVAPVSAPAASTPTAPKV